MAGKQLYTIGYEGVELPAFLATLRGMTIRQIIDVRELPLSRKRGFSKSALSDALRDEGIAYIHLKELGDPKPGRDAARRGDFVEFQRIYRRHLSKVDSQEGLKTAAEIATKHRSCLLCYEREPAQCHRAIISSSLAERWDFTVRHINVSEKVGLHHKKVVNERDTGRAHAVR
jgi:uncharacterized protein (DUF488 family)